ncbi:MAG: nucleotide exchange factor GrpE, partial [Defluviitaleaceae bacterium]|nr:nucleotide exchange factor GrpE [Defluviitaleaceae bacterium]
SIQRIIEPLALAHRRLDKSLYEIRRALSDERRIDPLSQNESEERGFPLTAAEFNAVSALNPRYVFLNEIGETNRLFKELSVKKDLFLSALETETEELYEQIRLAFAKAAYRFQRLVSVEAFLADDLSEIFDYLLRDLPKSDAYPEGIERDILSGIIETLQIKTESIRDGVAAFHADGARLVGEFTSGLGEEAFDKNRGAGPDGGGRTPAFAAVLSLWAGRAPSEKDSVQPFFDECFRLETFEGYASKQDKRAAEYQSKIDKLVLQFKKETILYEVNTYEEIITYSVSRLRQLTDENTQKAVALFDGAVASLGMLLKKNNIRQINPSPHEPFNGREHEVLIAEKQEGFGKGEIIKVINSGYQYKDTILMRANVIAAK